MRFCFTCKAISAYFFSSLLGHEALVIEGVPWPRAREAAKSWTAMTADTDRKRSILMEKMLFM
jgi:hypothetical protein